MTKVLILLADQQKARLFVRTTPAELPVEIETHINSSAKRKSQALQSDKPGMTHSINPHPMGREDGAHEHELKQFSHGIVASLENHLNTHGDMDLVLICAPKMLGEIRAAMKPGLLKRVVKTFDKDIATMDARGIKQFIAANA